MTLSAEQARALRGAGEFIKELINAGELSENRQQEARVILRHYPSATEIEHIDQMPLEEIAPAVEHPPATVDSQNPGRFAHLYGVLTAQEVADHLKCSPELVYERAVAGEFIFLSSPDRVDDRRYPAFQLDERLDRSLLKQTIQKYLNADVNSTLLWSFLRSPQKNYAGLTPVEMLVGGMPPQYDTLTPEERSDVFLDVVDEEISRVRW